jgi:cytochrome c-type biogenesis protein CcmE
MTIRGQLIAGAFILVSVTTYVAYLGASSSWQYYVTVDESAAAGSRLFGQQVRVSGRVARGSIEIDDSSPQAVFELVGVNHRLRAVCPKPLPDNFAEDLEVVVEGRITQLGQVQGSKVLTRCASKYESR